MEALPWTSVVVFLQSLLAICALKEQVECPKYCECLGTVDGLFVACIGTTFTAIPDALPTGLSQLYMRQTEITSLPRGAFSKYTALKRLMLSNNNIKTIDVNAFKGLVNLELLILNENELTGLPTGVFSDLSALKGLHLSGNKLQTMNGKVLRGLSLLEWLSLAGNRLETLPCDGFNGLNLKGLSLEDNAIVDFPECVLNGLNVLQDLKLSNNKIADLSARNFRQVPSLEHLSLSKNGLSFLAADLFKDLPKLKTLRLAGNRFKDVPTASFDNLKNLEQLILTENPIPVIKTNAFAGLGNLQNLYLRKMPDLETLQKEAFSGIPKLINLALQKNMKLNTLPMEAFPSEQLTNLRNLYLSDNAIQQFDKNLFVNLHSLQVAALEGNPLRCDCKVRWLHDNKACTSTWAAQADGRGPKCFTPKTLRGMSVRDVDVYDLTCQPPLIESTAKKTTVPPGGKISFEAILSRGVPTFRWMIPSGKRLEPGEVLNPGKENQMRVTQEKQADQTIKGILTLNDVTEQASGNYVLIATNIAGDATADYRLTVKKELLNKPQKESLSNKSNASVAVIILLVGVSVSLLFIVGVVIRRKFVLRKQTEYLPLIPTMDTVHDYGVLQ